jgi:A/G-specific adenine glycosylase
MTSSEKKIFFTKKLLQWHESHHRPLPWKGEKNPYLVWLSEIILQQTRVEQGLPYFKKFKEKYPTVQDLARAQEDEIMKMWEGLGYYSRARNLHSAAKFIAFELQGIFPTMFEDIRSLKGVGDYTAAAIASFAFDLPYTVVDGNVYRVLSRYFGIGEPIDTTKGRKLFAQLAQELLDETQPGKYNQAIMDFGATHCTPAAPQCIKCPFNLHCEAYHQNKTDILPIKSKKPARRQRFFNYLIINQKNSVFIKKRTERDIWQNLYDFPLIETGALPEHRRQVIESEFWNRWLGQEQYKILLISTPFKQELTHQQVIALFWEIEVDINFSSPETNWKQTERSQLKNFAFPKIIDLYFKQKFLPLELY